MRKRNYVKPFFISSATLLVLLMSSNRVRSTLNSTTDAQNREQSQETRLRAQLNSPSEIERFINKYSEEADLAAIWVQLGIATASGPPGRCGCREGDCSGTCKAEAIQLGSDGENDAHEILRICYAGEQICWFLLFKKEVGWKMLNVVAYRESRYEGVKHRLVNCGNKRWLVINAKTGGTGVLSAVEDWFEIGNNGLSEVLSYPVSGHSVQGAAEDYQLKTRVSTDTVASCCAVTLRYEILRDHESGPELHWTSAENRQLQFVWDPNTEGFVLNKSNSDLGNGRHNPMLTYLSRRAYLN
jgi:hypothetical protein